MAESEPQQTNIVSEARALAEYVDGLAAGLQDIKLGRVSTLLRQLCDEVEALRKHIADLNHDLEAVVKECNEQHG